MGIENIENLGGSTACGRRGAGRIGRAAISTTATSIALLVAVVAALSPPPAALAQAAAAVSIGEHEVAAGQTIAVAVRVADVAELYAADIGLSFDPAVVEVVDTNPAKSGIQSQPGSFLDEGLAVRNEADNDAGTIWYAATQLHPSGPKSGSGPLLVVTFRGRTAGVSPLTFTQVAFAERDGDIVPSTTTNGAIRVGTASSAPTAATATEAPAVAPPTWTPPPRAGRQGGRAGRAPTLSPEPMPDPPTAPAVAAAAGEATSAPSRATSTPVPLRASATPRSSAAQAATATTGGDPGDSEEAPGDGGDQDGSDSREGAAGSPAEEQAGAAGAAPTWTAAAPSSPIGSAGAPDPAADAPAEGDDGRGTWFGWLLAALVVAGAAFGYQRRRRGS